MLRRQLSHLRIIPTHRTRTVLRRKPRLNTQRRQLPRLRRTTINLRNTMMNKGNQSTVTNILQRPQRNHRPFTRPLLTNKFNPIMLLSLMKSMPTNGLFVNKPQHLTRMTAHPLRQPTRRYHLNQLINHQRHLPPTVIMERTSTRFRSILTNNIRRILRRQIQRRPIQLIPTRRPSPLRRRLDTTRLDRNHRTHNPLVTTRFNITFPSLRRDNIRLQLT